MCVLKEKDHKMYSEGWGIVGFEVIGPQTNERTAEYSREEKKGEKRRSNEGQHKTVVGVAKGRRRGRGERRRLCTALYV